MNLKETAKQISENETAHGFNENYNLAEKLMLVVTEISEAVEADRNGKYILPRVNLDMIGSIQENTGSLGFKEVFEENVKNTFGDELADAVIRILGISAHFNIDLEKHIELKMCYNSMREFKHGKKY